MERELIQAKGPGTFHFKHVLTQEAAYGSLLLSKRRFLHRRAAEALERMHEGRPTEIATHFLNAQEPLRALPYLVAAGEQALAAYSTPEALALFAQATAIAETGDDAGLARRSYEGLGSAQSLAADPLRAVEVYGAMEEYARTHADGPMRVCQL